MKRKSMIYLTINKYIPLYILVLLITIVSTAMTLVFPYSYSLIITNIQNKEISKIIEIAYVLIIVLLGLFIMDAIRYTLYIIVNNKVIVQTKNKIFQKLIRGNLNVYQKYSQADILNRIEGDINSTINNLTEIVLSTFTYAFSIILTFIVMIKISLQLTLVICFVSAILILLSVLIGKYIYKRQNELLKKIDKNSLYLLETLNGIEDIIAFRLQLKRESHYKSQNKGIASKKIQLSLALLGTNKLMGILISLSVIVIYVFGAYLNIVTEQIELGVIVSMVSYANLFFGDIMAMANINIDTNLLKVGFNRLSELEQELVEINEMSDKNIEFLKVKFCNVSFEYNGKLILDNISFTIKKGEKIAIIGDNGSGKSTLAKLLHGYYSTYEGSIKINDRYEMRTEGHEGYIQNISCVNETPVLFDGTVLDNLKVGEGNLTEEIILERLKEYNISFESHFLGKKVGYLGENLSCGERQKVAIARAFLNDGSIIILDEADTHLDKANYILLMDVLSRLGDQKTIINITHNHSDLEGYDKVYLIKDKKIML